MDIYGESDMPEFMHVCLEAMGVMRKKVGVDHKPKAVYTPSWKPSHDNEEPPF